MTLPTAREFTVQAIAAGASVCDLVTFAEALDHEADILSRASARSNVVEPYTKPIMSQPWCPPEYLPEVAVQC